MIEICWFCETEDEDINSLAVIDLHKVTIKKLEVIAFVHYEYDNTSINIPRCVTCRNLHAKENNDNLMLIGFAILITLVEFFYQISIHKNLLQGLIFPIIFLIISSIIINHKRNNPNLKTTKNMVNEVRNYPEIHKLLERSWVLGKRGLISPGNPDIPFFH